MTSLATVPETTPVTNPTLTLTNTLAMTPAVRKKECLQEGSRVLWVKKKQFKLVKWFTKIKKGKLFYAA